MPSTIDKPLVITLVHGTWADANAKWVQRDSILCQQLYAEFAQVEIHAFPWSGKNSVGARKMAAEDLRRHVESVFERTPQADHFVIGHSHGGSVALYAAKDEEIRKRVRGVACLSTPFLVTKRRNNVFWHVDTDRGRAAMADAAYAALFGILLVAAIGVYATTGFPVRPFGLDLPHAALAVYAEVLAAHLVAAQLRVALTKRIVNHLGSLITSTVKIEHELDLSGLDASGIFIARSVADEASSFIGTSQLIGWFTTRIWLGVERLASRAIGELVQDIFPDYVYRRFPRTLFGITRTFLWSAGIALGILTIDLALKGGLSTNPTVHWLSIIIFGYIATSLFVCVLFFSALITSGILLYLLAVPLTALLTLVSVLPFGWELAIRNILLGVSAESTPNGTWLIELVEPNPPEPGSEVPLTHSEIYDNEMAVRKLISWIRERSSGAVVS